MNIDCLYFHNQFFNFDVTLFQLDIILKMIQHEWNKKVFKKVHTWMSSWLGPCQSLISKICIWRRRPPFFNENKLEHTYFATAVNSPTFCIRLVLNFFVHQMNSALKEISMCSIIANVMRHDVNWIQIFFTITY